MDRRGSMNTTKLKQEIIEYSKKIGIDKIGFASTDVFNELKHRLKQKEKHGYAYGFEKGSIKERKEQSELLHEVQSINSITLAYPSKFDLSMIISIEVSTGILLRIDCITTKLGFKHD